MNCRCRLVLYSCAGLRQSSSSPPPCRPAEVAGPTLQPPAQHRLRLLAAATLRRLSLAHPPPRPPGQAYSFTPKASDPEGARLTFSITGKPSWATFDAATGKLSGTAAAGSYASISISVTDGTNTVRLGAFAINVSTSAVTTSSATVSWTPPTQRDDGTSLGNLAGYKIYYGTDPSDLSSIVAVNSAGVTSFTVDGLTKGAPITSRSPRWTRPASRAASRTSPPRRSS